jgi:hypothetical protein
VPKKCLVSEHLGGGESESELSYNEVGLLLVWSLACVKSLGSNEGGGRRKEDE